MSKSPDENLLLYVNVSGELFYIVIHRMDVQGIEGHLQVAVGQQLLLALTSPEVIQDVTQGRLGFIDRPLEVMRTVMKELVDGTIMKINAFSMEKLFELTLIATKYQYTVCAHPKDILLIALNHLDSLRSSAKDPRALEQTEGLHQFLVTSFGTKSGSEMGQYRWSVLHYLEDLKLKMTNLVNLGLQDELGEFVKLPEEYLRHPEDDSPDSSLESSDRRRMHSLELNGDRVITLGLSIYDQKRPKSGKSSPPENDPEESTVSGESLEAVQGLEFCSILLGGSVAMGTALSTGNEVDHREEAVLKRFHRNDSTQTILIDARDSRSSSSSALELLEITRKLEETGSFQQKRRDLTELLELFGE